MGDKSLYLGGGFREHQILYMIPIIDGICSRKKISSIIFEKKIPKKILKNKIFGNFFKKYQISSIEKLSKKQNILIFFTNMILFTIIFFCLSFFVNRKVLIKKHHSWFKNQMFHAIWDSGIINNKKKLEGIELKSRIKTAFFLTRQINIINLLKEMGLKSQ